MLLIRVDDLPKTDPQGWQCFKCIGISPVDVDDVIDRFARLGAHRLAFL